MRVCVSQLLLLLHVIQTLLSSSVFLRACVSLLLLTFLSSSFPVWRLLSPVFRATSLHERPSITLSQELESEKGREEGEKEGRRLALISAREREMRISLLVINVMLLRGSERITFISDLYLRLVAGLVSQLEAGAGDSGERGAGMPRLLLMSLTGCDGLPGNPLHRDLGCSDGDLWL